jgi:hypothetical protein
MGHRGDVEFTFEQVLDGEKPLFLPTRLLDTVPFGDLGCLVLVVQSASF